MLTYNFDAFMGKTFFCMYLEDPFVCFQDWSQDDAVYFKYILLGVCDEYCLDPQLSRLSLVDILSGLLFCRQFYACLCVR